MSQRGVKRFLALYFLIFFGAVFLRVDYFPLSWVPMYGYHVAGAQTVTVGIGDKSKRARGFLAWRANGKHLTISGDDLNIPHANFRRLYHQRAFNNGPPQDDRERAALMAFNRWWYERFVGPDPRLDRRYPQQLLVSVNRTFGYGPNDPRRIVRMEAELKFATFAREAVERGDLSNPIVEERRAIMTERGTFLVKGGKLMPMPTRSERDAVE